MENWHKYQPCFNVDWLFIRYSANASGGAFTSAKSAVSSWFRSWSVEEEEAVSETTENWSEQEHGVTGEETVEEAKETVS